MITRSMHKRSLDLFCGTKSFSKVAYEFNYEIYTLDILPKFEPTYCCDIMTWEYKHRIMVPKDLIIDIVCHSD